MCQDSSHSISDYYLQNASMWKQLVAANPPLKYAEDIELFAKYKDHRLYLRGPICYMMDFQVTYIVYVIINK